MRVDPGVVFPLVHVSARERVPKGMMCIAKHELTTLSFEQLSFEVDSTEPGVRWIHVREKHTPRTGDPDTAPRLFSFRLGSDNVLWSNARSTTGELEPISE